MKKILLLALMAAFTTASFAQFKNVNNKSEGFSRFSEDDNSNWSHVYVQYNAVSLSPSKGSSVSMDGLSAGFNWDLSLSSSIPLYLEFGVGGQITLSDKDFYKDFTMVSAKIPVSVGYMFSIPNTPIDIIPNAGMDLRVNFTATANNGHNDIDFFDKKDVGEDFTWNRVQVGAHIGANARFWKKLLVGFNYQFDFNDIAKECKLNQANFTVGYCF